MKKRLFVFLLGALVATGLAFSCTSLRDILEAEFGDTDNKSGKEVKDKTPPSLTVLSPTNGTEVGGAYQLTGLADDDGSGVETVYYRIGDGEWSEAGLYGNYWTGLIETEQYGAHTNYVYAVDKAGNISPTNTVWVERAAVPSVIILSPENGFVTNVANITVSGTASVDAPYSIAKVEVKHNNGAWQTATGTDNWTIGIALIDGENVITARAVSDNGKVAVSPEWSITLETSYPTIEILSPEYGTFTNQGTITVSGTASVDEPYTITKVEVKLNEGNWLEADGTTLWSINLNLTDGNNIIKARAIADNDKISVVFEIIINYREGGVLFVSIEGDDNNPGTRTEPLKSIQAAIGKAPKNSYIYVAKGVYTPGSGLNTDNADYRYSGVFINVSRLTILGGWNSDFTERNGISELDGESSLKHVVWIDNVANVTIDGFVIRGGNANGDAPHNRGGGVYINEGSGHLIQNTVISNNTAELGGGVCFYDTFPNVTHSFNNAVIYGNSDYGVAIVNINSNPQGIDTIDWGTDNTPGNNNWNYVSATGDDDNEGTKDSPFRSIQKAVSVASENHHIFVAEGIYTPGNGLNTENVAYQHSGAFIHTAGLTILGGWNAGFTERNGISELDGNSALKHVVWIDNVANVTIDGFVIRGGLANGSAAHNRGGGVYINEGSGHNIENTVISNNTASSAGGGVYVTNGTSHTISATITGNSAEGWGGGGGVFVTGGENHTISGTISGNTATTNGGGVFVWYGESHTISGTISGNTANNNGGGVFVAGGTDHTISGTISGNTANNNGGGVRVYGGTSHTISGTITGNTANYGGGGVYEEGGTSHTISGTITGNSAYNGGGVSVNVGTSHTISATITGNSATGGWFANGGGVFVGYGTGHTISGTITGNTSNNGGGVYFRDNYANNTHTFVSPTISGNLQDGVERYDGNSNPQGIGTIIWGSGNAPLNVAWDAGYGP